MCWLTFSGAFWGGRQMLHLLWRAGVGENLGWGGGGVCSGRSQGGWISTLEPCSSWSRSSWSDFRRPQCLCPPPAPWGQFGQLVGHTLSAYGKLCWEPFAVARVGELTNTIELGLPCFKYMEWHCQWSALFLTANSVHLLHVMYVARTQVTPPKAQYLW